MTAIAETTTAGETLSPAARALIARLSEPETAAQLSMLLDNLGTLSGLLAAAGSFLARGEEVMGNVASSYHELAGIEGASDLVSRVTKPETLAFVGSVLGAVDEARAEVAADPAGHQVSLMGLSRATNDPDVRRGLGFTVALLKNLGSALGPR